ncbi:MAG TPA: TlpA disulfide reductase family protein [Candidatus Acidoferrum sp.]|jgi:thiol-disulfide isomerase/thioredoxin|nr:TlpA disulfide reductase family protein [Candidatus Acidoferrum sp.]
MKRLLSFLYLTMAVCLAVTVRGAELAADADRVPAEQEIAKQRMMQIYDAIQAYRKDHKDLPGYLSDLYPQYIADTNVLICPTALRLGQELPFVELRDPKLLVHYGYEFSARPIQAMFGYSGPMTMNAWKRMQMTVVGGVVPILRCFAYDQVINLSFDGKFYQSPLQWEDTVADKVNLSELEPVHLRLDFLKRLGGGTSGEALAFEELQEAASRDNRGVVMSDQDLSEENKKWNQDVAQTALAVADRAGKFLEQYPQSASAKQAAQIEQRMLLKATAAGSTDAGRRLEASLAEKLKAPDLSEDQRFELRSLQMQAARAGMNARPASERQEAFARQCRSLIQEFPKRSEPYLMLLSGAQDAKEATVRAVVAEVEKSTDAPQEAKERAQALLDRLDLVGRPPEIQFTALDGRGVDFAKLKGKVVLVDFWATWCGPCVGEIPHVKEAYEKFHPQGFEIVGISFDNEKAALEKFVKSRELAWPQYFDGKGWQNKFGQRYGIESIPTMWLVDRKGNLVDTNARADLAGKVEHLIAEK